MVSCMFEFARITNGHPFRQGMHLTKDQRLPGACNRSPRSKAASNNNATALWWESTTAEHNFGRGPSNDYSIKIWF